MENRPEPIVLVGRIWTEHGWKDDQYVLIEDEKIAKVGPKTELPQDYSGTVFEVPDGCVIAPGFIDVHIHGAYGSDAMDATFEALDTMATGLVKEGTTTFFATTMTQHPEAIEKALKNTGDYIATENKPGKAEVAGIHLEGPFVNPIRKGAQPEEYIINPDIELFQKWNELAQNHIRLVTMAPERDGGYEFVKQATEQGVVVSIGHSDANFDEIEKAIDKGASHITHLYNGMKGLHHREPGTAGASLLFNQLHTELIVDGFHIHPKMVDLALRVKGLDRALLVTDSMRAKGLEDGVSELGGQTVYVKNGKATLENGSLAGSILKMNDAIKNVMEFANLSLWDSIKLATINPAREFGLDNRKGTIKEGKDADLVVLDPKVTPLLTIARGKISYNSLKR